jgi:hypothetical protein
MHFMTQLRRSGRLRSGRNALALIRSASLFAALPAAVLFGAGLSGCASSNTTSLINLPNGQTGFAVNCRRRIQLGLLLRAGRQGMWRDRLRHRVERQRRRRRCGRQHHERRLG